MRTSKGCCIETGLGKRPHYIEDFGSAGAAERRRRPARISEGVSWYLPVGNLGVQVVPRLSVEVGIACLSFNTHLQ